VAGLVEDGWAGSAEDDGRRTVEKFCWMHV
jgi:hypothetical protein